jgi:hypothetical protein
MTEDILFDNIYIGHSAEDAKAFAAETFDRKKPLEVAASKPEVSDDEDYDALPSFKDDPIGYIRHKFLAFDLTKLDPAYIRETVVAFVVLAKLDPVLAFKTHPETGAALAVALFTVFGMLGALLGVVGGQQKPITKVKSHGTIDNVGLTYVSFLSVNKEDRRSYSG